MGKLKLSVFGANGRMGKEVTAIAKNDGQIKLLTLEDGPLVVIDFSSPKGILEIAKWCAKNRVPLVSGTTGLSSIQEKKLKLLTKKIPLLRSPNFSLGLNAMAGATETFLTSTTPIKISVEEVHHKNKKDNPSGTAKFLQCVVKDNILKTTKVGKPSGLRVGEVFGLHKIIFILEGEVISFVHEARDRKIFAKGAIAAAKWLVAQSPGCYMMKDYLKGVSK
jgi:4-hydroxy-tetrahydrodipicolinate reductase